MSLFKKPEAPAGITFMVMGQPGTGKTRFALGVKRVTKLPCAYIGTDRGSKFYVNDPEIGGFLQVETRDAKTIDAAIKELEDDWGASFGAAVVDTVTDMWSAEQKDYEKPGKDGAVGISMRSWRPLRNGHEEKLRRLQGLPMHVFLVCEEKPIYEKRILKGKDGDEVDLVEVGSKEDADKKDAYVCDVRLRFFIDNGAFCAEVLKDRTGTYAMGEIIENPTVEMWVKSRARQTAKPTAPTEPPDSDEAASEAINEANNAAADKLIARIDAIKNIHELTAWTKKHAKEINSLIDPYKGKVIEAGKKKRAAFEGAPADSAAGAESEATS